MDHRYFDVKPEIDVLDVDIIFWGGILLHLVSKPSESLVSHEQRKQTTLLETRSH